MDNIHVSLENATVEINNRVILDRLTFDSSAGRIGVLGRNGSGKSTLARMVAGLIEPDNGKVRINGTNPATDRNSALKEVGILFQNPDHQIIFPTVLEELAFGLGQQGKAKSEAENEARATLERFGKSHWVESPVSILSQGQKHLLCLMAVAAMQPNLLILDEPFAGLDIPTRLQLTRHLSQYQGALLHITHNPRDLEGYDEVIWLGNGSIRVAGTPAEVIPAYEAHMIELGGGDDLSDLPS